MTLASTISDFLRPMHSDSIDEEFGSQAAVNFMASFFPVPSESGDLPAVSPPTLTIDIDIDRALSSDLSPRSPDTSCSDTGGSATPFSPVTTIMSALDLNRPDSNPSSAQDKKFHTNASGGAQTQDAIGQNMFVLYNNGSRPNQKSAMNTAPNQTTQASTIQGLGALGGGSSLNPQLLNMDFDSLHTSPNNVGGISEGDEDESPTGNANHQAMLEQFRMAQLQQLQHLQAQIFQQQLAIINGGAVLGIHSGTEGSPSAAQSQNQNQNQNQNQTRSSSLFHGLPTPGSSAELRASAPAVEFVSPMLLNYVADMNDLTNNNHNQSSYDASTSSFRPSHSHSHSHHSNPHSLTQTPVLDGQEDDSANQMVLDSLTPLTSRFSRNSGNDNDNDSSSFYHRGTSSAPAHIAFSHPHTQQENDFDISPLTSPWLGAEGGTGNARSRVQAYNHRHVHHAQQHQQQQSPMDWNATSSKRTASPVEDHGRKTRQSPAVRATIPDSMPGRVRKNSRSSRSVNSTPLLKGMPGRSRRGSVATSKTSPPNAGNSAPGTSTIGNNSGLDEVVQDSPSPVDLSLSMPPPATGPASSQSTNSSTNPPSSSSSSSNSSSTSTNFSVGLDNMNLGFDVGNFNFGGSLGTQTSTNRGGYSSAPGSMPLPLMPVTPGSIMNLGRGMNNPSPSTGVINHGGNENGMFGGFGNDNGMGMGRGTGVGEALGMSIHPPPSSNTSTSVSSSSIPPPIDTSVSGLAAGRKGKVKAAKDTTGGVTEGGISTRSKSGRKGGVGPSTNLKTILPAAGNSVTNSPILPPSSSSSNPSTSFPMTAVRKTSHKAAEQKRRDSLKTTFDDLRGLLPPIPVSSSDAADDLAGGGFVAGVVAAARASMLPGALPPRGPPKAGAEGPNKGVSKLQLLICGNEYIRVLKARVERRDEEIARLRREIRRLRSGGQVYGDEDLEEESIDLEKDPDAIEWASVRAQEAIMTGPMSEEGGGEED